MSLVPPIRPWNPAPLQDRVVLVTGGAQGIGRGIAQAVIGAGGSVVIGDLDADAGRACSGPAMPPGWRGPTWRTARRCCAGRGCADQSPSSRRQPSWHSSRSVAKLRSTIESGSG